MEEFKNRIEAELAGSVVKVLSEGNIEESMKYIEMFQKIDRIAQMKSYFRTLQQENFARSWRDTVNSLENTENPRFLVNFYDNFLNNWNKLLRWYRDIFNSDDGVTETVQVICDTLLSLSPTRENVISAYLKRINEKMELLQEISQANVDFSLKVHEKIEESNVTVNAEKLKALSESIFNYFNIFIIHYSSLEQASKFGFQLRWA